MLLLSKKITIFNIWPNTNENITWQLFAKECKDGVFTDTIRSETGNTRNDKGKWGGRKGDGRARTRMPCTFNYSLNCNISSASLRGQKWLREPHTKRSTWPRAVRQVPYSLENCREGEHWERSPTYPSWWFCSKGRSSGNHRDPKELPCALESGTPGILSISTSQVVMEAVSVLKFSQSKLSCVLPANL